MRKFITLLTCLVFTVLQLQATVIYVNPNATGINDGSSWANGYTDFQVAIQASVSGDSIFVLTAVYQPANGNSFSMKEGVKIFGGFLGTENAFSKRDLNNKATLKGNGNSVIMNDNNGLTADAELDGFIITGGSGQYGGGMYNEGAAPIIRNCIFENNSTDSHGVGGGIYNINGSATSIINCIFTGNSAGINGGGIYNGSSNARIINCVVWGNSSNNSGGGIYNLLASPVITNTVIWGNTATIGGNGLFNGNSARPAVSYCNIQDQVWSGTSNISQDPLFTDAAAGDFSLQNLSPCINTGNSGANSSEIDLAGNPRIMGPAIDMGAIERSPVKYVKLDATGNSNGSSWKDAYTDLQAAIDGAIAADSIFVATATYQPAIGSSFSMKEGVKIFGGFLGAENSFNQRSLGSKATLKGSGNSVITNDNNGLTASAVLDGFIITGGNADKGGGMYNNDHVFPVIRNCIFQNNSTSITGNGGGMYNRTHAAPTVINCIFTGNTAGIDGAGMDNISSDPSIINCVFWGNSSAGSGGGVYNALANPIITNTIIWGNTAVVSDRNGLYNGSSADPVISYCDIQDEVFSGTGNISQDPLLKDAAGGDYSLKNVSPCLDAGTPDTTGLMIGNLDVLGKDRIVGAAVDMGANEFQGITVPVDIIRFSGNIQNRVASFQWESAVENNLQGYIIEKSLDGRSFTPAANLSPKGSSSHYSYALIQSESIVYYRLDIVDYSGKHSYSDIIGLSQNGNPQISVSVYPNPAKDYIYLKAAVAGKINIFTASGRLIKTEKVQPGLNKISIRSLSSGIYFIRTEETNVKFIKQ